MSTTTTTDWPDQTADRTARAFTRREVFDHAYAAGLASIPSPRLARAAGVPTRAAWAWLRGRPVSPQNDEALRRALGLNRATRRAGSGMGTALIPRPQP